MTDEERQRTMDFILQQMAQFAAGMQRLEEKQAQFAEQQAQFASTQRRADGRIDRLERIVLLMAQQFRRERHDLRESIAALVDAQVRTEEAVHRTEEAVFRTEEAVRSLALTTERNSKDIAALSKKTDGEPNDTGGGSRAEH